MFLNQGFRIAAFLACSAGAVPAAVVSSFGTGGTSSLLENHGDSAAFPGIFADTTTGGPSTQPAYSGTFGVTANYQEPAANDASVTVSGEPGSLKLASGAGASFTGPGDYQLLVTMDFAMVGSGYLPASSWLHVVDLDGNSLNGPVGSRIYTLTALDSSGNPVTSPWLDTAVNFDGGPDPEAPQPSPGPGDYPMVTESGGAYAIQGAATATATPVLAVRLTQNVRVIQFQYFGSSLDNTQISIADQMIPEPSIPVLLLAGGVPAFSSRRRRLSRHR